MFQYIHCKKKKKACDLVLIPVFSLVAFWVVGEIIERGLGVK